MGRTAMTFFCSSKPKTAWRCSSLSTYLLENCAKQSSSTLSIVYTPIQKIIMVNMVNTSLQFDSIPSSQVGSAFDRCYFFMQITIASVAVSLSRQWRTLLLTWREHDESLTWWWQDNRRPANLLFLWKASFSCSQRCLQTVYFLLPPPLLFCTDGQ